MYIGNSGDVFCEVLVKHQKDSSDKMKMVLAALIGVLVSLAVVLFIPQLIILLVLVWALVVFLIRLQSYEYEYSFTAGDLDIDRIAGNYKRKRVYSISMNEAEIVAAEGDYQLDQYKYGQMKDYDFSANDPQMKNYILIGNHNGEHVRLIFTPNEKMIDHMRMTSPGKVKRS